MDRAEPVEEVAVASQRYPEKCCNDCPIHILHRVRKVSCRSAWCDSKTMGIENASAKGVSLVRAKVAYLILTLPKAGYNCHCKKVCSLFKASWQSMLPIVVLGDNPMLSRSVLMKCGCMKMPIMPIGNHHRVWSG